ncbi:MAG TPA: GNAT family N-acyltransferase [Usitatibacter sp.]
MAAQARTMQPQATGFDAEIVRDKARISEARALRERVLARDNESRPDPERFEDNSDHLVVRDAKSGDVAGAYRILSPGDARRAGGYMAERDFDLALLVVLRERMVEIDRPCVDPRYPYASVMTHLWSALARYLIENRYDYVFGAASVTLRDGGHAAASIHRVACARFVSPEDYRVFPRRHLPLDSLCMTRPVTLPPLLKGYLDLGAWVCGEPALVAETDSAQFPILLPLARMRGGDARDFLAKAT